MGLEINQGLCMFRVTILGSWIWLNCIYADLDSNVTKLYYFAAVFLLVPKNAPGTKFLNDILSCYLTNNATIHSNMSQKIKCWDVGRLNRLNCVVHIWHLVRVPGTRSNRKTFGVYPPTFSSLEDHRVYRCIPSYIPLYTVVYTVSLKDKKG